MPQKFTCAPCLTTSMTGNLTLETSPLDPTPGLRFALLRRALGAALPVQEVDGVQPLVSWVPHSDLSAVLFELWAYVGDIIGLYNGMFMAETSVATARHRRSLRRLADLLGYQARPAVGGVTELAALVAQDKQGTLPPVAYRSSTPAQMFESHAAEVSARVNEFRFASVVEPMVGEADGNRLLLDTSTASAVRSRPIMFLWHDVIVRSHATEILEVSSVTAMDAREYVEIKVAKPAPIAPWVEYKSVALVSPSQRAYLRTGLLEGEIVDGVKLPAIQEEDPLLDSTINSPPMALASSLEVMMAIISTTCPPQTFLRTIGPRAWWSLIASTARSL
ncbi:hypothetical protein [Nannocystis pusilla]|uniref:hypothetical protein n=1 Tax=Nannocystis pusilla TaxID=889268 RepID=UPI003B8129FE